MIAQALVRRVSNSIAFCAAVGCINCFGSIITQWNFNGSTGTTTPSTGAGTATAVGSPSTTFFSGNADGGSSDPDTSANNLGWSFASFASQGNENKSRGAQFAVSTVGFENVRFAWDQRNSNTASRWAQIQYTVDGSTWIDFSTVETNAASTWFNGRIIDFSSISNANNNANFGIRILSIFAPGTSSYAATDSGSSYGTTGTWRFDMVTFSGDQLAAVPEPASWLVFLGLFGLAGTMGRRSMRRFAGTMSR